MYSCTRLPLFAEMTPEEEEKAVAALFRNMTAQELATCQNGRWSSLSLFAACGERLLGSTFEVHIFTMRAEYRWTYRSSEDGLAACGMVGCRHSGITATLHIARLRALQVLLAHSTGLVNMEAVEDYVATEWAMRRLAQQG